MTCTARATATFFLFFVAIACVAQQQTETMPEFPNVEEIQLVVAQSERVFEQYKQSVTMEAELPTSKANPEGIDKDLGVYGMAKKLIAALKVNPEGFHGVGGLLLLSALDDAARNAALCSGTAASDVMNAAIIKSDVNSAKDWLHVGSTCVDVSNYLYTVSESVEALLIRDLKAQQGLNNRAQETLNSCAAALKKSTSSGYSWRAGRRRNLRLLARRSHAVASVSSPARLYHCRGRSL